MQKHRAPLTAVVSPPPPRHPAPLREMTADGDGPYAVSGGDIDPGWS